MAPIPELRRTAEFSPCERYRYRLGRYWDNHLSPDESWVTFLMLNPSTADASIDDPTIRRCIGSGRDWGFRRVEIVNIFALRSTDPKNLRRVDDPVGPGNDAAILDACQGASLVVVAWGNHGMYLNRGNSVLGTLRSCGITTKAFGMTGKNQPLHPLYLRKMSRGELIHVR